MRRRIVAAGIIALGTLAACTPEQTALWLDWHSQDPAAAETWARTECGDLCTLDWDRDGIVEPDTPPPARTTVTARATTTRSSGGGTVWDRLAQCESGGNWAINTGNGYQGGLQFLPSTWRAYGGSGAAHNASREQQIAVAERVLADVGWRAWPACTSKLGLR